MMEMMCCYSSPPNFTFTHGKLVVEISHSEGTYSMEISKPYRRGVLVIELVVKL